MKRLRAVHVCGCGAVLRCVPSQRSRRCGPWRQVEDLRHRPAARHGSLADSRFGISGVSAEARAGSLCGRRRLPHLGTPSRRSRRSRCRVDASNELGTHPGHCRFPGRRSTSWASPSSAACGYSGGIDGTGLAPAASERQTLFPINETEGNAAGRRSVWVGTLVRPSRVSARQALATACWCLAAAATRRVTARVSSTPDSLITKAGAAMINVKQGSGNGQFNPKARPKAPMRCRR